MKAQSTVQPKEVEILGNKVLVRSNIELIIKTDEHGTVEMYEYDEIRHKKDEYIQSLIGKTEEQEGVISDLVDLLFDKGVIY